MAVKLTEPPHDDIKRASLLGSARIWTATVALAPDIAEPKRLDRTVMILPSAVDRSREQRIALPRASLADAPSAA